MIIGTAGHIDHGKTSLVRCLSGVDTDRLPEEKQRGLTIDLGFAQMDLQDVGQVGIVDVPGHERFVRNMVAGATGIDVALFVVAADDGVMLQTLEHLDIVSLLGVRKAVVALNKTDLVEPARIAAVTDEIRGLLRSTPYADAAVVPVSARTCSGIDALREALASTLGGLREKARSGFFRMPLDRAFSMPGFGLVVTGTIASGEVAKDARVRLLPGGAIARVRGIQVHGKPAERAGAGSRCALNLSGVEKSAAARGVTAGDAGLQRSARVLDAALTLAQHAGRVPRNYQRVRVHIGTAEVLGRMLWLAEPPALPGEQAFAQLRLDEPVAALYGDRFILRSEQALATLGGGIVLDPFAARRGTRSPERAVRMARLRTLDPDEALNAWLDARAGGWALGELAEQLGEPAERLAARLAARSDVVCEEGGDLAWVILARHFEALMAAIAAAAAAYLAGHPRMTAVPAATLHSLACARLDARAFRAACARLVSARRLEQGGDGYRPAGHRQRFSAEDERLAARLLELLGSRGATPPKLEMLAAALGVPAQRLGRFLGELVRAGKLVKVAAEVYVTREDMERWRALITGRLAAQGRIGLAEFRDAAGVGRGLALQLLEHFDRSGLTRRSGDVRVAALRAGDRP